MKRHFKVFSVSMVLVLLITVFSPASVTVVKAATKDDDWFEELRDSFAEYQADNRDWYAGAYAAQMNGDNWFWGGLLGSILAQDVEYYHNPSKIFDKINNAYKNPTSSNTTSPNCTYYYTGQEDNSITNNYQVFEDHSDYSTQNYNYQWYNPITNTYNTTENFYYKCL